MAVQNFNLADIGLSGTVDIEGTATILNFAPNAPIVFLFDEHHTTSTCLQENMENGDRIKAAVPIGLIGVESHKAKCQAGPGNICNNYPDFADHFLAQGMTVYGVECEEFLAELEEDIIDGLWPAIDAHPYNTLRSYYYLAILFRTRRYERLMDNLFLNAGTKHIDHIASMIALGQIDGISGEKAAYVRIHSTTHPAHVP